MEHATGKDGKAEHPGEWTAIFLVFALLVVATMAILRLQQESSRGQFERLEAIEFQLSCLEHQQFVNVDGEFFCAAEEAVPSGE